ncbi:hypothetical protein PVK06_049943 [Gossypium arboreum]|uniref:RNA-dependent RNA polymerase n=1 Tax=Gossypium arboreum TaxID=29729 RepID=A0ABR0M9P6_GOSAR|nr:hypothetical protein PVK06_049943 [Gossypium arboreum]
MCYYYPDAAKLGGAIMAGEGSTSAPSECFWWQVGVEEWHGLREKESQRSEKHTILGIQNGATGGDAEATRVGLVRYDIKRPHAEVRDWLRGLIRKLANRYLSQALSRPLYQGISWEPTWKALPTDRKRPGQSRRERGIFANFTSELSHSVESGAGRRRVFAVGNYVNQRLLRPLHNWLMEALGDLKTDGTFNQSAPLDRLVGAKKIYSIDLKAATDRWPLLIQLDLLKSLFGHEFADEVGNLLGFTMFGVPLAKSLERTNDSLGFSFQVVCGDDIIITDDRVSSRYQQILDSLGVIVSKDKTLVSDSGCGEFAKKFRTHGLTKDFSPVSFRNVMNSHHLLRIPYHFCCGLAVDSL